MLSDAPVLFPLAVPSSLMSLAAVSSLLDKIAAAVGVNGIIENVISSGLVTK
jgi:hypothetical protein